MAKAGYVWSGSEWENFTGPSPETLPAGTIVMWVSSTAPTGWLICNGAQYSTSTYADLYTNLGNSYELGTETFGNSRLPNFQDRFPIGSEFPSKVEKSSAYQTNSVETHLHTFVPSISVAIGNTAHNHNLAPFNNDHAHNTNTPTTNGGGDHNHPMNAHNPNADPGTNVPRLIGSSSTVFSAHSHNANAPSTTGGGAHNHGLNAWSTNNANVASHSHSTNYSSLNTHNHSITNNPVNTAVPTTTVIPPYRAIYFIIKATNG
jgi:microcystin-dependent protein